MPKLILDMSEEQLAAAQSADLVAALVFRLEYTESLIWSELDVLNDRAPGFGNEAKVAIANELEDIAAALRTFSPPHWAQTAD